jgi:hypothetical protein
MILVLPGYTIYYVNNLMVLLFVCLVTLIWHRYQALNFHLKTKKTSFSMLQALNVPCYDISTSDCHHSAFKRNSKDCTLFCNVSGTVVHGQYERPHKIGSYVSKIRKLRELHDKLHNVVSDVNIIYGFQILADITNTFIDSVTTLYFSIMCAKKEAEGGESISYHGLIVHTSWMLLFLLKMIAITMSCHFASNEASDTANILHKKLLTEEMKPDTEKEIQSFLQQVTNNKLYFSACGFFHINLGTLCAMISSVTTYLIILLQL